MPEEESLSMLAWAIKPEPDGESTFKGAEEEASLIMVDMISPELKEEFSP